VTRDLLGALPSVTSRGDLENTICTSLADSTLYRTVCMADRPTWAGHGHEWTVAEPEADETPALPAGETLGSPDEDAAVPDSVSTLVSTDRDPAGVWTIVPLTYDRTVYGVLCLRTTRRSVGDYERAVLRDLGTAVGHLINAVETRRLLSDSAVIEVELVNWDANNSLIDAARRADCRFELEAFVPATEHGSLAYLTVENATPGAACTQLAAGRDGRVQTIREAGSDEGGLIAWAVGSESMLGLLVDHGANVTGATAYSDRARYTVELPSCSDLRAFLNRIKEPFPQTWLCAKRELERPVEPGETLSRDALDELTDRQREALEAAYYAGYYSWPRDSTAEDVAETLDITGPTLHAHLRKAENQLLGQLIDVC
jgi:predicted DNA binding protein